MNKLIENIIRGFALRKRENRESRNRKEFFHPDVEMKRHDRFPA